MRGDGRGSRITAFPDECSGGSPVAGEYAAVHRQVRQQDAIRDIGDSPKPDRTTQNAPAVAGTLRLV
jgi:hypothetical protein